MALVTSVLVGGQLIKGTVFPGLIILISFTICDSLISKKKEKEKKLVYFEHFRVKQTFLYPCRIVQNQHVTFLNSYYFDFKSKLHIYMTHLVLALRFGGFCITFTFCL